MGKSKDLKAAKISASKQNELKILADAILVKSREKTADEFQFWLEFNGNNYLGAIKCSLDHNNSYSTFFRLNRPHPIVGVRYQAIQDIAR